MKKRLIAIICVLVLALTMFAGCEKKNSDGGITELLWYIPGNAQPDQAAVMEEVNKILADKIGVKLDIQFIPSSAYSERMKMTMASGAEYDLCFTSNWLNDYKQAVDNGALYDLTDLIDEEILGVVPKRIMKGAEMDGRVYAVPNMQIMAQPLAVYARKDLLDKYGFDLQTVNHIEDIEPFLEMVKNGETGIFPIRTRWATSFWVNENWAEMQGCGLWFNYNTHEFLPSFEVPEYKQYVNTMRDWYSKGYIRSDVSSVGDDTTDSMQNKYAVQMTTYKPGQTGPENQTNCEYEHKILLTLRMSETACRSTMTGISITSKNPEKAYELIKLVNTDKELYNLICNGIEGKHYELTESGKIIPDEKSGYCPNCDWKVGCQFNALLDEGMPDDAWEQTIALNDSAETSPLSGFTYDDSETSLDISNVTAVMSEYSDFITVKDFDKYLSDYTAKLKEAGSDKLYDDIEKQVKAFLKENKIKPAKD